MIKLFWGSIQINLDIFEKKNKFDKQKIICFNVFRMCIKTFFVQF